MPNSRHSRRLPGFTLIELLVVIAIIGLLSTVIAGPVQSARKKGRDAKKIADIRAIQSALSQYAEDNGGTYPSTIAGLVPKYIQTTIAAAAASTPAKDKYMYVTYRDAQGNILGYHLGVKLENNTPALQSDADCYAGSAARPCSPHPGSSTSNWSTGAAAANAGNLGYSAASGTNGTTNTADFNGAGTAEALGGVCTSTLSSCIYDVVPEN